MTETDWDGTERVNGALMAYVQPVGETFEAGAVRMEMIDAIFDGYTLVLSWTIANTGEEPVLLLCDPQFPVGEMSYLGLDEEIVLPGDVRTGALTADVFVGEVGWLNDECIPIDELEVGLRYTIHRVTGDVVTAPLDMTDTIAWAEEQAAQGVVALNEHGHILSNGLIWREGMTRAESVAASGLFEAIETLDVGFTLARNTQTVSLLPQGKPLEKSFDGYTVRVLRAELAPNTLLLALETVFDDEASAAIFMHPDRPNAPTWLYEVDSGSDRWSRSLGCGPQTPEPVEAEDGRWVWPVRVKAMDIIETPSALRIRSPRGGFVELEVPGR